MKYIVLLILFIVAVGCTDDPSKLNIENKLPKAVIRNAQWGEVRLASQLLPGETSRTLELESYNYYDVDLPARYPVKFYIDVNGDRIYLQTRDTFRLGIEDNLTITIDESTPVLNLILEGE